MSKPGNPNDNSSDDLERARALSRALSSATPTAAPAPSASRYVSFAPRGPAPRAPTVAPAVAPAVAQAPHPAAPAHSPAPSPAPHPAKRELVAAPAAGFGPAAWDALLDACLSAARAQAAFLMDPHGLVISSRGASADPLEAVGSRLMLAFEQADRIGAERTLSLSAETARGTLFGMRLVQADGSFLLLGVVVPGGLSSERQQQLTALVGRAAEKPAA